MTNDTFIERRIIQGMILNDTFISKIEPFYRTEFFEHSYSKMLSVWAINYFRKNGFAAKKNIFDIYKSWEENADENIAGLIARFLDDLNDDWAKDWGDDDFNIDVIAEEALKYFRARNAEIMLQVANGLLSKGDVDQAEATISDYKKLVVEMDSSVEIFNQPEEVVAALEEGAEPLLKFPGDLGKAMNENLVRGSFVAFQAKDKVGKTFWLYEIADRSLKEGLSVAFFEVGDMTKKQALRRWAIKLSRAHYNDKYVGDTLLPISDCIRNQQGSCMLEHRVNDVVLSTSGGEMKKFEDAEEEGYSPCTYCRRHLPNEFVGGIWYRRAKVKKLTPESAIKHIESYKRTFIDNNRFKLSFHSSDSITVSGINSILNKWRDTDNFVPDVVLVDYADLLAAETGDTEERHKVNKIWKRLRKLSQDWNVLLATATQADANTYKKETQDMSNFSEDKRKLSHVTAYYGINQTPQDKKKGFVRINEIVVRDGNFNSMDNFVVLQALQIGAVHLGNFKLKEKLT